MTKIPTLISVFLFTSTSVALAQSPWTLQRCIDEAFSKNITIKQGELQVEISEINQVQNAGALLPTLNGQAAHGYNWGQTIDPFTNTFASERIRSNNFGLGTGITLFNGFQNINRVKQGAINIEVQKANLQQIQNDVALNVTNAFLNVLFQEEFVNVAKANLTATEKQVKRINDLVDAGAAPRGQLLEINSQKANDEATLIRNENGLAIAYLNLRQLLMISESEAEDFIIARPNFDDMGSLKLPDSPKSAVNSALNRFPEIKSAQAAVESASIELKIAKGGTAPRINMSYSYGTGYSGARLEPRGDLILTGTTPVGFLESTGEAVLAPNFEFSEGFDTKPFNAQLRENLNQSLFFSMTVPIFNGFAVRSNIKRAQVGVISAANNLELSRMQLRQTVESAYADAIAALNNFRAAEQNVSAAELAFEYAEASYEQGASNIADYTAARSRLDAARADLIRNRYDYLFRVKVVEFYMGQPLTLR
jgi:outer membrane protein